MKKYWNWEFIKLQLEVLPYIGATLFVIGIVWALVSMLIVLLG